MVIFFLQNIIFSVQSKVLQVGPIKQTALKVLLVSSVINFGGLGKNNIPLKKKKGLTPD